MRQARAAQRAPADDRGRRRPGRLPRSAGSSSIEELFNYKGIGQLIYDAPRRQKDFPLLQRGVLVVGIVYLVVTLIADILYAVLNPRIRFGGAE